MQRTGSNINANYIQRIASWHESSDGRGIPQLARCKANHEMLNFVLDEWMPWHKENRDFSKIDINRYYNIC